MSRVGQNHVNTVYIRYFRQGNHQIYGVYIRFWPTLQMSHFKPVPAVRMLTEAALFVQAHVLS